MLHRYLPLTLSLSVSLSAIVYVFCVESTRCARARTYRAHYFGGGAPEAHTHGTQHTHVSRALSRRARAGPGPVGGRAARAGRAPRGRAHNDTCAMEHGRVGEIALP